MNKIDLFFAKHLVLTYIVGVFIIPFIIGQFISCMFSFSEAWQYGIIFGFIYGFFLLGPKIKTYKEFNKNQLEKGSANE